MELEDLCILELVNEFFPILDDKWLEKLCNLEDEEGLKLLLEGRKLEDLERDEDDRCEELDKMNDDDENGVDEKNEFVDIWLDVGGVIRAVLSPPMDIEERDCRLVGVVWLFWLLLLLPKFGFIWALVHESAKALSSKLFLSIATISNWYIYC